MEPALSCQHSEQVLPCSSLPPPGHPTSGRSTAPLTRRRLWPPPAMSCAWSAASPRAQDVTMHGGGRCQRMWLVQSARCTGWSNRCRAGQQRSSACLMATAGAARQRLRASPCQMRCQSSWQVIGLCFFVWGREVLGAAASYEYV
jgi:hypothetical protein